MFNKTTNNYTSEVVAVTKVVEKSVSPDKVADIYKDSKEEAENRILRTIHVDSNEIHGVIVEMREQHEDRTRRVYTKFVLNRDEYISQDFVQSAFTSPEELVDKLIEHYKDVIARKIVKENLKVILKLN